MVERFLITKSIHNCFVEQLRVQECRLELSNTCPHLRWPYWGHLTGLVFSSFSSGWHSSLEAIATKLCQLWTWLCVWNLCFDFDFPRMSRKLRLNRKWVYWCGNWTSGLITTTVVFFDSSLLFPYCFLSLVSVSLAVR